VDSQCYTFSVDTVRVLFLGTGDAFSAGGRHQAAYLIQGPEGSLLLDCGSSFLAALKSCKLMANPIDAIFISHLHGDHFAGLPFLFLHWTEVEPRFKPLTIIGPPEVERRVMQLYSAMYPDSAEEPLPFPLEFIEAQTRKQLVAGGMKINPFHVLHQIKPQSLGCEIEAGGRRIVYSGDSGWTEELLMHTQNADLFICECTYFETQVATHMNYLQIAQNLDRFGSKRIVLTHLGEEVLERQQDTAIELAHDGLEVTL
jgi:ribonuclease BN (tRNA processing enzyme)